MATTGIWKVEKRLDHVIDYVINPEKTTRDGDYQELHKLDGYEKLNYETEEECFVSALNCSTHRPYKDMMLTKELYGKKNGILGYHAFQSFKEGEITPTQAHLIGVKLAEEIWGDRFEVIVSTHTNCKHIHNHFVLNSVSFVDGKKYRDNRSTYAIMRRTSDEICRENNLSVIEEKPCGKLNIDYSKYYSSYLQRDDYHTLVKADVDFAIKQAYSYNNFEDILIDMGYTITIRAGKISLCKPPYKRNIRITRAFGEEYSMDNIEERIMSNTSYIPLLAKSKIKRYKGKNRKSIRYDRGSLYRLYLYYCYMFKVFPKNNRIKLSENMKKEVRKMEQMSNEIKFICRNKIKSTDELFSYKKNLSFRMSIILLSNSTHITLPALSKMYFVSVPNPGPISITKSSLFILAESHASIITLSSIKKFCPKFLLAVIPYFFIKNFVSSNKFINFSSYEIIQYNLFFVNKLVQPLFDILCNLFQMIQFVAIIF